MPRPCSICTHSRHRAIDEAMVAGEPFRRISRAHPAASIPGIAWLAATLVFLHLSAHRGHFFFQRNRDNV